MSILIVFRGNCDRNNQIDYIYKNHKIKDCELASICECFSKNSRLAKKIRCYISM